MKTNIAVEERQQVQKITYTLREVASMLGVSYQTAAKLVADGKLRPCTPLRMHLFTQNEINRFLGIKTFIQGRALPR